MAHAVSIVSIGGVSPSQVFPLSLKRKLEASVDSRRSSLEVTFESLQIKLELATQRRESFFEERRARATRYRVRTVEDPSAALERLESRLAAAEAKREAALQAVRSRASVYAQRAARAAHTKAQHRHHLESRMEESVRAARAARAAHLARTAAKAASLSQRAETRQRDDEAPGRGASSVSRRAALLQRLGSRSATPPLRIESSSPIPPESPSRPVNHRNRSRSPIPRPDQTAQTPAPARATSFPDSESEMLGGIAGGGKMKSYSDLEAAAEQLKLHLAARRLQRQWRAFSRGGSATTQAVAHAFVRTGIPFNMALPRPEEATADGGGIEDEGDDPSTECHSPISTLNVSSKSRFYGNSSGSSGGQTAPANTPASGANPVDTPAVTPRAPSPCPPAQSAASLQLHSSFSDNVLPRAPVTPPMAIPVLQTPGMITPISKIVNTSPLRPPPVRLATSLAEMAATAASSGRAAVPAPLPAFMLSPSFPSLSRGASGISTATCGSSGEFAAEVAAAAATSSVLSTFDEFAAALSAPATLKAAQSALRRVEVLAGVKGSLAEAVGCTSLLRRVFPRLPPGTAPDRYPPRAFLCAYMVLAHPEVVLNGRGAREEALSASASAMLVAFEDLLSRLLQDATTTPQPPHNACISLGDLLRRFDLAWVAYLEQFVAWKSHDASGLEADLIRAAVELETSRLAKLAAMGRGPTGEPAPGGGRAVKWEQDVRALAEGVDRDLELISDRVARLTGAQGVARLVAALSAARVAAADAANASAVNYSTPPSTPPNPTMAGLGTTPPSPSLSPVKKVQRLGSPMRSDSSPAVSTLNNFASEESEEEGGGGASAANLALLWQLLYDPEWQLPVGDAEAAWADAAGKADPMAETPPSPEDLLARSPEDLAATLHSRVRRIADRAFWDSLSERLVGDGAAAAAQVAKLLAEAGAALMEVLPQGAAVAGEVAQQLVNAEALLARLQVSPSSGNLNNANSPLAGINCQALFQLLEWTAALLASLGSPGRDADAATAAEGLRAELAAAGADAHRAAAAVSRALRLLTAQLKLLRLDVANAHLRAIALRMLRSGTITTTSNTVTSVNASAVEYAQSKLESPSLLGPAAGPLVSMAARLPHTRGWLALASGRMAQVESLLSSSGADGSSAFAAAAVPERLRSGRAQHYQQGGPFFSSAAAHAAPALQVPVACKSWQGLVRCGLAQLVAGEGAVALLALPETLRLDTARLASAQSEFQRLIVLTAALSAMRQINSDMMVSREAVETARRRLGAVLAAPDVRLADVASEVTVLSGVGFGAEPAVHAALRSMLGKSSSALREITAGVVGALSAHLLLGPGAPGAVAAAAASLARCGAGALGEDVAKLAGRMSLVVAVTEAVCGPWYAELSSDLC